jgi:hypothetical protein
MLQFLTWVANRRRTYAEAMEAWRSSCPRLTVWEDAILDDLVAVGGGGPGEELEVRLTARGRSLVEENAAKRHR